MPDQTTMIAAGLIGFGLGRLTAWLTINPVTLLLRANHAAYALFAFDKAQAEAGGQRVPEATLLAAAARGGWIGAKLAQRRFRHKTRKEPFRSQLNRIGWRQFVGLVVLAVFAVAAMPLSRLAQARMASPLFVDAIAPEPALPRRIGPGG